VTDAGRPRDARVVQADGRSKAYRPLPPETRRTALVAGIDAYRRGDFFEAHELLEPAWMGTDDIGERALIQGLIKLAAAYVHGVRQNPRGVARNLEGARERLVVATDAGRTDGDVDVAALLEEIDRRLAAGALDADLLDPPTLPKLVRPHP
jgi:predicted metal-dependent hydrolase